MIPPPTRVFTVGLVVPTLMGAAFLVVAGVNWFGHLSEAADSVAAEGTVVAVRPVSGVKNQVRYKPTIRFQSEGRVIEFDGGSDHDRSVHPVGSTVPVRYPRGRPADAWIDDFANVVAMPLTLGVAGSMTLLTCATIMLRRVLRRNRHEEILARGETVDVPLIDVRTYGIWMINGQRRWRLTAEHRPASVPPITFRAVVWAPVDPPFAVGKPVRIHYLSDRPAACLIDPGPGSPAPAA